MIRVEIHRFDDIALHDYVESGPLVEIPAAGISRPVELRDQRSIERTSLISEIDSDKLGREREPFGRAVGIDCGARRRDRTVRGIAGHEIFIIRIRIDAPYIGRALTVERERSLVLARDRDRQRDRLHEPALHRFRAAVLGDALVERDCNVYLRRGKIGGISVYQRVQSAHVPVRRVGDLGRNERAVAVQHREHIQQLLPRRLLVGEVEVVPIERHHLILYRAVAVVYRHGITASVGELQICGHASSAYARSGIATGEPHRRTVDTVSHRAAVSLHRNGSRNGFVDMQRDRIHAPYSILSRTADPVHVERDILRTPSAGELRRSRDRMRPLSVHQRAQYVAGERAAVVRQRHRRALDRRALLIDGVIHSREVPVPVLGRRGVLARGIVEVRVERNVGRHVAPVHYAGSTARRIGGVAHRLGLVVYPYLVGIGYLRVVLVVFAVTVSRVYASGGIIRISRTEQQSPASVIVRRSVVAVFIGIVIRSLLVRGSADIVQRPDGLPELLPRIVPLSALILRVARDRGARILAYERYVRHRALDHVHVELRLVEHGKGRYAFEYRMELFRSSLPVYCSEQPRDISVTDLRQHVSDYSLQICLYAVPRAVRRAAVCGIAGIAARYPVPPHILQMVAREQIRPVHLHRGQIDHALVAEYTAHEIVDQLVEHIRIEPYVEVGQSVAVYVERDAGTQEFVYIQFRKRGIQSARLRRRLFGIFGRARVGRRALLSRHRRDEVVRKLPERSKQIQLERSAGQQARHVDLDIQHRSYDQPAFAQVKRSGSVRIIDIYVHYRAARPRPVRVIFGGVDVVHTDQNARSVGAARRRSVIVQSHDSADFAYRYPRVGSAHGAVHQSTDGAAQKIEREFEIESVEEIHYRLFSESSAVGRRRYEIEHRISVGVAGDKARGGVSHRHDEIELRLVVDIDAAAQRIARYRTACVRLDHEIGIRSEHLEQRGRDLVGKRYHQLAVLYPYGGYDVADKVVRVRRQSVGLSVGRRRRFLGRGVRQFFRRVGREEIRNEFRKIYIVDARYRVFDRSEQHIAQFAAFDFEIHQSHSRQTDIKVAALHIQTDEGLVLRAAFEHDLGEQFARSEIPRDVERKVEIEIVEVEIERESEIEPRARHQPRYKAHYIHGAGVRAEFYIHIQRLGSEKILERLNEAVAVSRIFALYFGEFVFQSGQILTERESVVRDRQRQEKV